MPPMWCFTERETPLQANKFYTPDRAQRNSTEEHGMQQGVTKFCDEHNTDVAILTNISDHCD